MKYCQFCGTQLEDGEQCTCQEAQEAAGQKPILTQEQKSEAQQKMADAQRKAKDTAMGLWSYLKAYFVSPAQAVRENAAQNGMMVSLLLTVIRVLSMELVVFGILNNLCRSISSALGSIDMKVGAPSWAVCCMAD